MRTVSNAAQVVGRPIALVGVAGVFAKLTSNDGALAITGAVIFAAGLISRAVLDQGAK
jgi:hypothetical protein